MPLVRESTLKVPPLPASLIRSLKDADGYAKVAYAMLPRFLSAGAQWTDLATVLPKTSTVDGWSAGFEGLGASYLASARSLEATGATTAARRLYALASLYLHYAHMVLEPDGRKAELVAASIDAYECVGRLSDRPPRRLEVPVEGGALPGYLWPGRDDGAAPTVVLFHGGDSGKPEILRWVDDLRQHGLTVFTADAMGQGEARMLYGLVTTKPMVEGPRTLLAILDVLGDQPEVDIDRVALAGECAGGFAALVSAPSVDTIRAVGVVAPRLDPNESCQPGHHETTHMLFQTLTGGLEPLEYDVPAAVAACAAPLLVVAGEQDRSSPARAWAELLARCDAPAELVRVERGVQVLSNAWQLSRPLVSDWLEARLADGSDDRRRLVDSGARRS